MKNRLLNVLLLSLVLSLSLFLLIFVGLGEARRTYPQFVIEKLAAQGEIAQTAIQPSLLADLPLDQFPGFESLTDPILNSDSSIDTIYVAGPTGKIIFSNRSNQVDSAISLDLATPDLQDQFSLATNQPTDQRYLVYENEDFYQVAFELRNRFEAVGTLYITTPKEIVSNTINDNFGAARIASAVVLIVFALFIYASASRWMSEEETGWSKSGIRLLAGSYGAGFLIVAILVTYALLNTYVSGIQSRSRALTDSLAYRLNAAIEIGLSLEDFQGVDEVFSGYKALNPDLSFVALTENNQVVIHTNPTQVGDIWVEDTSQFEYTASLAKTAISGEDEFALHLGVPKSIIYQRLWRSAKNFLALFIASAFITQLFFSLIRSQSNQPKLIKGQMHQSRGYLLSLIGPAYFIMIFVTNGITASFLPQYFKTLSQEAGLDIGISSLFSIYYLTYALSLVAAAKFAEGQDTKPLLIGGGLLILVTFLLLTFVRNFFILFAVQTLTGFGEGIFFIAVQSYILQVASAKQRTKGAAIVVNSLYGGMLSGTAIGALLSVDPTVGQQGVFAMGSLVIALLLLYIFFTLPKLVGEDFSEKVAVAYVPDHTMEYQPIRITAADRKRGSGFWDIFRDIEFIKTALFIGIPVKIINAGLFKASLPLVLAQQDYPTEDVGQIMMLYSGGVLLSSAFISRLTDKIGKTRLTLFLGAVGSGLGLFLIGLIGWENIIEIGAAYLTTLLLLSGMLILGIAHGFIQAPIITHVASTRTAQKMGSTTATSIYRLFERIGNIGGPLLVGGMLVQSSYNASTVSWIGTGVLACGVLFLIRLRKSPTTKKTSSGR